MDERSCAWMSGPRGTEIQVSAAKWWLAISRDVLSKEYRRHTQKVRTPVTCTLTPKFSSPLSERES